VATFVDITLLRDAERLQAVLDSLPEHVAVLDGNGIITVVNRAWREFAASNGDPDLSKTGIGSDYLSVCDINKSDDGSVAARAHDGLIGVLNGSLPSFSLKYPCHSPERDQWFLMHAAPIEHPNGGIIVSHIDITHWDGTSGDGTTATDDARTA
jgi:two-component system CheB/CheR fusion protein